MRGSDNHRNGNGSETLPIYELMREFGFEEDIEAFLLAAFKEARGGREPNGLCLASLVGQACACRKQRSLETHMPWVMNYVRERRRKHSPPRERRTAIHRGPYLPRH